MKQASNGPSGRKGIQAQQLTLPKGGGAIKGLGETFAPDGFSGTGGFSIPLPVTPARGAEPQLALSYQSGSGNGPFGMGFSLSLPKIGRRTERGIPRYNQDDIFVDGGDELVCVAITPSGDWSIHDYQPRIEEEFSKIEHWVNQQTQESYWQVITGDNAKLIFGKTGNGRIADPDDPARIFEWLIEQSIDAEGNRINYAYKAENDHNVPNVPWEKGRALSNKYIRSIQYGNFADPQTSQLQFAFEVVFDYGEYDLSNLAAGGTDPHTPVADWAYRPDAFSSYRSGFEIRTRRRCCNVLLFHNLQQELGAPCLVDFLSLAYADQSPHGTTEPAALSLLQTVLSTGCRREGTYATDKYDLLSLPPLDLTFSGFHPPEHPRLKSLTIAGNDGAQIQVPGSEFQPVDMAGEGIAGLMSSSDDNVWYMAPQGEGSYLPPRTFARFPIDISLADGQTSFMDLEGNGELDLVVSDRRCVGFYPRQDDGTWGGFTPFASYPNNRDAPYMESVGLNGDGKTDVLVAGQQNLLIYESLGQAGFAAAVAVPGPKDFPVQKSASETERVTFADMFGDGLSHRVRISNGCVECWPDLGYGRFGEKITLGNAPCFDTPFDISRLHLADIDGSGTADLIYVFPDRVALFLNRSGNSFSEAISVDLPETCTELDRIGFADVLGNGTTCLTFTKTATNPRHYYYNFVGETLLDGQWQEGLKPYLLNEINNNMGARTLIQYASSTQFYLADKKAGRPWITKLHFPVQVVEQVTTVEEISGARFVQRFAYHDGFYDTVEKEFRGFGYIEAWDTQTYAEGQTIGRELYVPPVYTRSWYHTGVFDDEGAVAAYYKSMYYQGDKKAYDFPDSILPAASTDTNPETLRQAHVALKGHLFRQEVYGQDGSPQAVNPYTVEASNFDVRLIRPVDGLSSYAVFMVAPRESIAYDYERNPDDPRVHQSFTLCVDAYGNVTRSCEVFLPRRSQTAAKVHPRQKLLKATIGTDCFINETGAHRLLGINCQTQEFELCGLPPPTDDGYFSFESVEVAVETALGDVVAYEAPLKDGAIQARQLTWSRRYFWNSGQTGVLPLGQISSPALPHHREDARFTKAFLQEVFAGRLSEETVTGLGGYFFDETSGYYWNRGLVQHYLGAAGYFLPNTTENSFASRTSSLYSKISVAYDRYCLQPIEVSAYVDENTDQTTRAEIDYIALAARQVVDINANVSQVLFDPLGHVTVTTLFGTQNGEPVGGMSLYPYGGQTVAEYTRRNRTAQQKPIDAADILANPDYYLQGAASFFYYNLHRWTTQQQPACTVNLVRNDDYHCTHRESGPYCRILVGYGDGLGRTLEAKLKTDPDPALPIAPRWQVTGRTVYNNKGAPCEQYLPYFSPTPDYENQQNITSPVPPSIVKYDPLGRVIKTISPKKLFSKVVFTPWAEARYDEDDTVTESEFYQTFMEHYPPDPTQRQQDEKDALDKAAKFVDTPEISVFDAAGHRFLEIQTETGGSQLVSYYPTDISGRVTEAVDPRLHRSNTVNGTNYFNFRYRYAMGAHDPDLTDSIDAGIARHFSDIYGNLVWSWSPRDYCQLVFHDNLQRRASVRVMRITGSRPVPSPTEFDLVEVYTYGDALPNPQDENLCGRLYQLKDLSGIVTNNGYDLRGLPQSSARQLVRDYQTQISWNGPVALEPTIYTTSFTHNAVGHLLTETTPDNSTTANGYNQAGFLKAVQVRFADNTVQQIIENITYDPSDQRKEVVYGNGVVTRYCHEPTTLRVLRILSTRSNGSKTGTVQDNNYTYDPVGNVTRIRDNTVQTIFRNNQQIDPLSDFTCDALYRLIKANGRQHQGIAANTYLNNAANNDFMQSKFSQLPSTNQADALENYSETYSYDDSGNLISKRHSAKSLSWPMRTPVEEHSNRLKDRDYDHAGNMRTMEINGAVPLTFNYRENLISTGIIERPEEPDDRDYCLYDSGGQRTRKVSQRLTGGGVLAVTQVDESIYLGNYEIKRIKTLADGTEKTTMERQTIRVMDGETCITVIHRMVAQNSKPDDTRSVRFQMANQQGSVALEMDHNAKLISYEEYFPYGGTAIIAGKNKAEVALKTHRYCGKERDNSTGLYYYGARYYAPWLGRWLKPDPAGTIDGLNLYAFVSGNPVRFIDRGGFAKGTAKKNKAKRDAKKQFGTGHDQFYDTLEDWAERSRKGNAVYRNKVMKFAARLKTDSYYRQEIHKRVRVRSRKVGGAKKGFGKDELFKTSKTGYFAMWAAGLIPGKEALSYLKVGSSNTPVAITVLTLQRYVRADTAVVYFHGLRGAHTGAYRETTTSRGYITKGQADMHEDRQDAIENSSTPRNALIRGLHTHLEVTANWQDFQTHFTTGFDVKNRDFSDAQQFGAARKQFGGRVRDQLKYALENYKAATFDSVQASPAHQLMASPMHSPADVQQMPSTAQYGSNVAWLAGNMALADFANTQ